MKSIDTIKPVFYITEDNKKIIKEIENKLDLITIDDNDKKRKLRVKSKVRSIHSSLAIEANSLSLESVESIVDNKMVLGDRKEIQEVKNANELYEHINEYNWKNESDFLKAHTLMMKYFDDDNGYYRNHGEGVKKGNEVIYTAPQSILVPSLMKNLFNFITENEKEIHPLILSSIFHYYFVYIHPFSDGNGRMARFWVSLILTNWNSKFEYIPIESQIEKFQDDYYNAIAKCHVDGESTFFIEFMLSQIDKILDELSIQIDDNSVQISGNVNPKNKIK